MRERTLSITLTCVTLFKSLAQRVVSIATVVAVERNVLLIFKQINVDVPNYYFYFGWDRTYTMDAIDLTPFTQTHLRMGRDWGAVSGSLMQLGDAHYTFSWSAVA